MIISQEQKEFFVACKKNDVTNFKKLIQNKNVSVRAADSKGMSCLNLACSKENEEMIKILLEFDSQLINISDENGVFPIEWIVKIGNVSLFNLLLEKGADFSVNKNTFSLLHLATYNGNIQIVERLLNLGFNINLKDDNKRTPLIWAAEVGDLTMLKFLISNGANVNLSDEEGFTAMDTAVGEGHLLIVKELILKGVDVNQRTQNNGTVLHTAVAWERAEIIKLLLDNGAKKDIKDAEGKTPFQYQ